MSLYIFAGFLTIASYSCELCAKRAEISGIWQILMPVRYS